MAEKEEIPKKGLEYFDDETLAAIVKARLQSMDDFDEEACNICSAVLKELERRTPQQRYYS